MSVELEVTPEHPQTNGETLLACRWQCVCMFTKSLVSQQDPQGNTNEVHFEQTPMSLFVCLFGDHT